MPKIAPFRAIRYQSDTPDISPFIAPPYDVISPAERATLISHSPHNVVLLELPDGSSDPQAADSKYAHARDLWNSWLDAHVLDQDDQPAFYLMEQDFTDLSDKAKTRHTRTSIFGAVKLHDFKEGKVLPHEATLPKALGDRYELLHATQANFSPIFGMYAPTDELDQALSDLVAHAKSQSPLSSGAHIKDDVTRLWRIDGTSPEARRFQELMADTTLLIADGHHRYTVGVAHMNAMREKLNLPQANTPQATDEYPFDYIMMGIVKMDDPGLLVLPYHRAAKAALAFDPREFKDRLSQDFDLIGYEGPFDQVPKKLKEFDVPAFAFAFPADAEKGASAITLAALKKSVADRIEERIGGEHSRAYCLLDTVVLQNLVLKPLLNIDTTDRKSLERFSFSHDIDGILATPAEQADVILLMRSMNLMQIAEVSASGDVTPQKSTYFHPKFPSGFLFRDLAQDAKF